MESERERENFRMVVIHFLILRFLSRFFLVKVGSSHFKGPFTPSGSGSVSGSEDSVDFYLSHTHQASASVAVAAALLAAKHQMGSGPIFPAMPLPLYWVSFDFNCCCYVFYYL